MTAMPDDLTTFSVMSESEFSGRVAIVTGSSAGIGEATARRLSALGATVVVNSASSVELGEEVSASLPGESMYVRADIADQAQGHALVDRHDRASTGDSTS